MILLRSDKSNRTACRAVLLVLSRAQVEISRVESSRVLSLFLCLGFCDPIFVRVCNSRFHILPLELLLNRLIYCHFRGVHGRQVQQGAVFPRWKMPDDRRRHRCLSLPTRLHGRSLRNPGGPAGNRIIFEGIISPRTYHRVYARECGIMRNLAGVSYYFLRSTMI